MYVSKKGNMHIPMHVHKSTEGDQKHAYQVMTMATSGVRLGNQGKS
jgi:hypothetical protein